MDLDMASYNLKMLLGGIFYALEVPEIEGSLTGWGRLHHTDNNETSVRCWRKSCGSLRISSYR